MPQNLGTIWWGLSGACFIVFEVFLSSLCRFSQFTDFTPLICRSSDLDLLSSSFSHKVLILSCPSSPTSLAWATQCAAFVSHSPHLLPNAILAPFLFLVLIFGFSVRVLWCFSWGDDCWFGTRLLFLCSVIVLGELIWVWSWWNLNLWRVWHTCLFLRLVTWRVELYVFVQTFIISYLKYCE